MLSASTVLGAIGFTEPSTFGEFCGALGDDKPDKGEWAPVMRMIDYLEREGYIEVERDGRDIEQLQLTESGKSFLKDLKA